MIKKEHLTLLLLLCLFCIISNYLWVRQYSSYSFILKEIDEIMHLRESMRIFEIIKTFSLHDFKIWCSEFHRYPAMFYISASIFNLIFGASKIASVMTNSLYVVILIFAVYFLGKKIWDDNAGIISAFLISFYPIIFGLQRWFFLDFALTAMVTMAIALLIHSDFFTNRNFSFAFLIFCPFGMFTKWTFFLFVLPLFLYVTAKSNWRYSRTVKLNIVPGVLLGLMIGFILYFNARTITALKGLFIPPAGNVNSFVCSESFKKIIFPNWQNLTLAKMRPFFYPESFIYQISPIFFILFLLILPLFIRSRIKYKLLLTVWIIFPLVVFTIFPQKWASYLTPALPSIAVITAIGLCRISNKWLKNVLITVVATLGFAQYLLISNRIIKYHHRSFLFRYLDPNLTGINVELGKIIHEKIIPLHIIPRLSADKKINIIGVDTVPQMRVMEPLDYAMKEKDMNCRLIDFYQTPNIVSQYEDQIDYIIIFRSADALDIYPKIDEVKTLIKFVGLDKVYCLNGWHYYLYTEILYWIRNNFLIADKIDCFDKYYFYILKRKR